MRFIFAHHILNSLLLGALLLGVTGCGPDDPDENSSFDQGALLRNIGTNLIVPNYQDLQSDVTALQLASDEFVAAPTTDHLVQLRSTYLAAYTAWGHCSAFELGPASDRALRANVNTFPTDTSQINQNIATGQYDLAAATNLDAKGFPALDYLLYGLGDSESEVVSMFTQTGKGTDRINYLAAAVSDLKGLVDETVAAWNSAYLATFEAAEGTDVGSSLGKLVNQLNYDYEILKKPKLGIPMGVQTLGTPLPANVEAYYSGQSLPLMRAQFEGIANLYHGRSRAGVDGYGLHEALEGLNATYAEGSLAAEIASQISTVESMLADLPGPLSETVVNDPDAAEAAYTQVQRLVVLFKTDMSSALGILITYVDNDGD